jgi:type II secretory pathway pseudopilin PulG
MERLATLESDREAGYVLVAVIFMTMLVLISLAIAAPMMARSIQRDKELETIHRGQQYKRAIKLYYQKFGSYPTSIDQLVQTNQIRFLRKRYKDPLTGKDDWKPVLFGQAHVRPLGFFGQPLMVSAGMGGTSAGMYAVATTTTTDANGVPVASTDSTGGTDGTSTGSNGFPGNTQGGSSNSSGSGSSNSISSMFGQSGSGSGSGSSSSLGMGSSTNSPTGGNGTAGGGTSATTFGGGGPIVGFTLPIDKPSLVLYKHQTRYNKWEFNYDPAEDQAQALAGLTNGASTGGVPTNGTGPGTTTPGSIPQNPATSPGSNPVTDPGSTGGSNPGSNPTSPPTDSTSPQ